LKKIGVFDSGIGGMKIASLLWETIPEADIYYYADQAFAPYGNLTSEKIYQRCEVIVRQLIDQGVDLIVIACNTATSVAIKKLRENFKIKFVGVEPDLNFFHRNNIPGESKIGVLTTPVTIKMEKFNDLRLQKDPNNSFIYTPMPNLASLVEGLFFLDKKESQSQIQKIKNELIKNVPKNLDYLILGCTHYGLIDQLISDTLNVQTVCPSSAIVKQSNRLLGESPKDLFVRRGTFFYYSSKDQDHFKKMDLKWKDRFKNEKLMS